MKMKMKTKMKTLLFLMLAILGCQSQSPQLYDAATIGQKTRNQKAAKGLQVNDSLLLLGKFWLPADAGSEKIFVSDASGFGTWKGIKVDTIYKDGDSLKYKIHNNIYSLSLLSTTDTFWRTNGNYNTDETGASPNFIGTMDSVGLLFKVHGERYNGSDAFMRYFYRSTSPLLEIGIPQDDHRVGVSLQEGKIGGVDAQTILKAVSPFGDLFRSNKIELNSNSSGGESSVRIQSDGSTFDSLVIVDVKSKGDGNTRGVTFFSIQGGYTFPLDTGSVGQLLGVETNSGTGLNKLAWVDASNDWSINGNAGTNDTFNFIGTTDNVDLVFKRNNIIAGRITSASFPGNVSLGVLALRDNTGYENTAIGREALKVNTTGGGNTAIGHNALSQNTTGSSNSTIGNGSMYQNTTGFANVGIGYGSLSTNTTGQGNTCIGGAADVTLGNLGNATAIGYGAQVDESNKMQFGSQFVTKVKLGVDSNVTLETGFVKVTGGSPGVGKVLTSDASGLASWQNVSESIFTNSFAISANGSDVSFDIPIVGTPFWGMVVPNSPDAAGIFYITLALNKITVTYTTPPPSGSFNLAFQYSYKF
jgi:hypothetical protein